MQYFTLTWEDRIINGICTIFAFLVLAATLYPFYWVVMMSFNDGIDSIRGYLYFFPRKFTTYNYRVVFVDPLLIKAAGITILRTAVGTVATVFFTAMVSYGLSKRYLMFRKVYTGFFVVTMYFGGGLIPFYLLLRALGLLNSFWVYIVPSLFAYGNVLLFMAFFRELPEALEEAARIDGASEFTIFLRLIMPLSMPIMATIALFVGVYHWNDWFSSAYYTNNMGLWTLPTMLIRVLNSSEAMKRAYNLEALEKMMHDTSLLKRANEGPTVNSIRYAMLVVTVFPITIAYPFLQRFFVKGILMGSLKA